MEHTEQEKQTKLVEGLKLSDQKAEELKSNFMTV